MRFCKQLRNFFVTSFQRMNLKNLSTFSPFQCFQQTASRRPRASLDYNRALGSSARCVPGVRDGEPCLCHTGHVLYTAAGTTEGQSRTHESARITRTVPGEKQLALIVSRKFLLRVEVSLIMRQLSQEIVRAFTRF